MQWQYLYNLCCKMDTHEIFYNYLIDTMDNV